MMSAIECFTNAAKCEAMARAAQDEADRTVLLATAQHWRTLGELAKKMEGAQPPKWPSGGAGLGRRPSS